MKTISIRAFTLVEVVIALAVVSFAVVTLLALIPTGMTVYQQAQTGNVETEIVQKINGELQNSPYTNLFNPTTGAPTTYITGYANYYDMEGEPTNSSSGNPAVYAVTLTAYPFTNAGSVNVTNSSGYILAQTVQYTVVYHNARTNTFSALIVNKGY